MKIQHRQLDGSVLATVLVVSVLLLLGVLIILNLWQWELSQYYFRQRERQADIHITSGFMLWEQDSTLWDRLDTDSTILLFEGREDSRVRFKRELWGMYEVVQVGTVAPERSAVRLLGKVRESIYATTLYVPENDRSFSLAGRTFVEGGLYLPENGITYVRMRSEFFQGKEIEEKRLKKSGRSFPEQELEVRRWLAEVLSFTGNKEARESSCLKRSFRKSLLWVRVKEYMTGMHADGHIILFTPGDLFIEQDNHLENVIVVARKVEIADGFTGCMQVFARDSILLGDRVCLKPGSGLYISQQENKAFLRLGEENELNGYVVIEQADSGSDTPRAVYYQPETSRVRGLVFVDGIAEVHGFVTGSLYARDCYYFAPEGYYSNMLYNAILPGNAGVVYPLYMEGAYERKEVKCLY